MSHFFIFIHEYIIFPLHLASFTLSLYPPTYTGTNPQIGPVLLYCSLFLKKGILFVQDSYTGSSLVMLPCMFILYYNMFILNIGSCPIFFSFLHYRWHSQKNSWPLNTRNFSLLILSCYSLFLLPLIFVLPSFKLLFIFYIAQFNSMRIIQAVL
jgi:hypothetical protein